jgi:hypothetical protein
MPGTVHRDDLRLTPNLQGLGPIRYALFVDAPGFGARASKDISRRFVDRVGQVLKSGKVALSTDEKQLTPMLMTTVKIMNQREWLSRRHFYIFRIETTLREPVATTRKTPTQITAETWRHLSAVGYLPVARRDKDLETMILSEASKQAKAFVADYSAALKAKTK